jgi:hypothetical protein
MALVLAEQTETLPFMVNILILEQHGAKVAQIGRVSGRAAHHINLPMEQRPIMVTVYG